MGSLKDILQEKINNKTAEHNDEDDYEDLGSNQNKSNSHKATKAKKHSDTHSKKSATTKVKKPKKQADIILKESSRAKVFKPEEQKLLPKRRKRITEEYDFTELKKFEREFRKKIAKDAKACEKLLLKYRGWSDNKFKCPRCGHTEFYEHKGRGLWQCKNDSRHKISLINGTIFHYFKTDLAFLFLAIYMLWKTDFKIKIKALKRFLKKISRQQVSKIIRTIEDNKEECLRMLNLI